MSKFVVFIKSDSSKVFLKEKVTSALIKELKHQGYTKHHVVVEAEDEKEAIVKLNEDSESYLNEVKGLSASAVICGGVVIILAIIYFFKSWII